VKGFGDEGAGSDVDKAAPVAVADLFHQSDDPLDIFPCLGRKPTIK